MLSAANQRSTPEGAEVKHLFISVINLVVMLSAANQRSTPEGAEVKHLFINVINVFHVEH